jgi:hypothetical protein
MIWLISRNYRKKFDIQINVVSLNNLLINEYRNIDIILKIKFYNK